MKASIIVFFSLFLIHPIIAANKNASTGLPFLKLGIGGRALGMGEAYTALSEDVAGVFYNPAGISWGEDNEITLMHKSWAFGTSTEFLGSTLHTNNVTFGMGLNSTSVDDIEIRQQPGPSLGTFALHDFSASATVSLRVDTSLSIGATGKFLYEKIYIDESQGFALDLGARYQLDRNWSLAAVLSNIGAMSTLLNEAEKLPTAFRSGAAFHNSLSDKYDVTVSGDYVKVLSDNGSRVHIGGEITYDRVIALRTGYQFGYEAKNWSIGFGICHGPLRFDYAFVPFIEQLGNTHTFALTFSL